MNLPTSGALMTSSHSLKRTSMMSFYTFHLILSTQLISLLIYLFMHLLLPLQVFLANQKIFHALLPAAPISFPLFCHRQQVMKVGEGLFSAHIVDTLVRFLMKFAFVHIVDTHWRIGPAYEIKLQLLLHSQCIYILL